MLILPALVVALHLFGQPSHWTRRPSATKFWAVDTSCGAGSISSPVLSEHPKNVSEVALLSERVFGAIANNAPPWLLVSMFSIASREMVTRQVQDNIVPALISSEDAQPKALEISQRFRRNFDLKVKRLLRPAGYKNTETVVRRILDAEMDDMKQVKSFDDLELTRAMLDLAEEEVSGRIQDVIGSMAGLNQTTAERDLYEIIRRADSDGNEVITFDELYELMLGQKIDPQLEPFAREWAVLKTPRTAGSKWERWGSLLLAPQLKRISQLSSISRRVWDRTVTQNIEAVGRDIAESIWLADRSLEESLRSLSPRTREDPAPPSLVRLPPTSSLVYEPGEMPVAMDDEEEPQMELPVVAETRLRQHDDAHGTWRKPWRWLGRQRS